MEYDDDGDDSGSILQVANVLPRNLPPRTMSAGGVANGISCNAPDDDDDW